MLGFSIYQYLLKSYSRPNGLPHLAYHAENNLIKCNHNCPRSNSERFCSFCVVVALKPKCLKSFAHALGECRNKTTTQLAPQKITNEIGGQKAPGEEISDREPRKISLNNSNNIVIQLIPFAMMYVLQVRQTCNVRHISLSTLHYYKHKDRFFRVS